MHKHHAMRILGLPGAGGVSSSRDAATTGRWQLVGIMSRRLMSELESSTSQCTSHTSSKTEALKLVELTHMAAHPSKPPSMEVNVKQLRFLAGLQEAVQDLVSGKPCAQQPPPPHTHAAVKFKCGKRQHYDAG